MSSIGVQVTREGSGLSLPATLAGVTGVTTGDNVDWVDGGGAPGSVPPGSGDFELKIEGGQSTIFAHGSAGSTETIDPTDGNVHTITLNANCTFTLNAPTGSGAALLELWITQDSTGGWAITWPGSVTVQGTLDATLGTTSRVLLDTIDGGTTWIATVVGSGGSSATVFYNVEAYGAVGDNSTDDTTAIQSALNAAQTAGGGRVYFPHKYKVTATLMVHTAAVVIFGDGGPDESSMIRMATSNTDLFDFNNSGTLSQFEDIYLEGPNTGTGRGIVTTKEIVCRALRVRKFYKGIVLGSGSFYSSISQSFIGENLQTQIETTAVCNNFKITDTYIYGGAYGIDVLGAENFKISGGSVEGQTTAGIRVNGGSSNGQGGLIDSIYFENGTGVNDILIGDSSQVQGLTIVGCSHIKAAHAAINGWSVRGSNVLGLTVLGGYTDSTQAILVDGSSGVVTYKPMYRVNSGTETLPSGSIFLAFDSTAPSTSAIGDAASAGTATAPAHRDHLHGREALSTATPLVESGAGSVGTGVKSSREDHVHPAAASSGVSSDHAHVMDCLFSGDASTTAWTLPVAPVDQYSVAAYVSGVLTEVTLSGTLFDIATFGSAPASATNNIRFDIVAAVV